MCKAKLSFLFALMFVASVNGLAQNISIEDLIERTLDSSYILESNEYLIKRANIRNTTGYAGNLPSLQTTGQGQIDLNSSRLQFFDGATRTANNAGNYSAGISLDLTYPIYEAGAKSVRKNQLENQLENTRIQYRLSKQDLLLELLQLASEYNLYLQYVDIYASDTIYWGDLSDLQKQIFEFGRGNRIDLIQVRSELNLSKAQLIRNQQQLDVLFTQLSDIAFLDSKNLIDTIIGMQPFLNKEMIKHNELTSPLIELERNQLETALLAAELTKSFQFPVISAFAGYGYSWSRNAVGILLSNQNFGPYAGLRLNWNLYDGNQTKIDIQSFELQAAAERSDLRAAERAISYQKRQLEQAIQSQRDILQQEQMQRKMLQEQFEIVEAQYTEGKINILEVLNYKRQVLLNQLNIAQAQHLTRTYRIQWLYDQGYLSNVN